MSAETIIQIKRSFLNDAPISLSEGELAYSFKNSSKTLYIGDGTNIIAIGGQADHDKLAGIESGAQVNTVFSVAGKVGAVTLVKADITDFTESDYVHTVGTETIAGDKTFSNNVVIGGDLTVNGTVTHINSTTIDIGDNILVLNSQVTGTPTTDAGLEIERGTSDNAFLLWSEVNGKWGSKLGTNAFVAFSLEGHTHVASEITDFDSAVDARITNATLDNLSDVVISTPVSGQVLKYNGTNWVNIALNFTELSDAPSSYTGNANRLVAVNSGETGLTFVTAIDGGTF